MLVLEENEKIGLELSSNFENSSKTLPTFGILSEMKGNA